MHQEYFFIAMGSLENPITGAHLWPLRQGYHFALFPKQRDLLVLPRNKEKYKKIEGSRPENNIYSQIQMLITLR